MPVIPSEREGSKKDFSRRSNDNDSELGVFAPLREIFRASPAALSPLS